MTATHQKSDKNVSKKHRPGTKAPTKNLRLVAAHILSRVMRQHASLSSSFNEAIDGLNEKERPLFQELCYGSLRQFFKLQEISEHLLKKPLRNKDSDVYAFIILGLYQLIHMRIPEHAVISETVNAAKKLKNKSWASGLINGVLRTYLREKDSIHEKTCGSQRHQFSHPEWFVKRLKKAWPDQWQAILKANNEQAPLTLRVNQQHTTRESYLQQLALAHIDAIVCDYAPDGIRLNSPVDISSLPGFHLGHCSVQDEAAQLAAYLLDLQPGQRVLDACCAPGGKTCHILECEPNLHSLTAIDSESTRMQRVEENLKRLQLKAQLKIADANDLANWWDNIHFDRILLDAPCSATGVIRRHPDIKLLRRDDDIAELGVLQRRLLEQLWSTLRPGGLLVYATCSVLPDENEAIVNTFLNTHNDATLDPLHVLWGEPLSLGRQLFPNVSKNDGFYYARLRKKIMVD